MDSKGPPYPREACSLTQPLTHSLNMAIPNFHNYYQDISCLELASCRAQHWRRNTRFVSGRSLKGSAIRYPTTHTISLLLTTKGTYGRSTRGILLSTKKSCSFFDPGAPRG